MAKPYPYNMNVSRALLTSPDTYAFTLMCILLTKYDTEISEEEGTSVLFKDIEDDFNVHLSEEAENRINAAITVLTTGSPPYFLPGV